MSVQDPEIQTQILLTGSPSPQTQLIAKQTPRQQRTALTPTPNAHCMPPMKSQSRWDPFRRGPSSPARTLRTRCLGRDLGRGPCRLRAGLVQVRGGRTFALGGVEAADADADAEVDGNRVGVNAEEVEGSAKGVAEAHSWRVSPYFVSYAGDVLSLLYGLGEVCSGRQRLTRRGQGREPD